MNRGSRRGVLCAVLAAAFYALNALFSKLLLGRVSSTMMAAFLYLGAGAGMWAVQRLERRTGRALKEQPLTRRELPYTIGMVVLDIAAPIALMAGLTRTTAANASLLNNFEIVATSLIALCVFGERISPRLWAGIALVTLSSVLLSCEDMSSLAFSSGSLLVLLACVCWGLENNCTRRLSARNPVEIVTIKGLCSGAGSFVIALCCGEAVPALADVLLAMCLGFVAYGLSIVFYIYAQRELGAAKTSAYYAIAPFIGTAISLVLFRETPALRFWAALGVMALGTWAVTASDQEQAE